MLYSIFSTLMNPTPNDEIYFDWMSKWRLWKKAWCECDEPVVNFYVKFIVKGCKYTPNDHADLAAEVGKFIGTSRVDKGGIIEVHNKSVVRPTISKFTGSDRLGIMSLKLSFFSRPEILRIVLALERLGHGVLHDHGRVVSTCYVNVDENPRKLPVRDDPVWSIVEDECEIMM